MNPPDFRSLCAEFVGAVDALLSQGESPANPGVKLLLTVHVEGLGALAEHARAALAQPVAEGPSYREVMALRDELDTKGYGTVDLVVFASAVLARWGRTTPLPLPATPADEEVQP